MPQGKIILNVKAATKYTNAGGTTAGGASVTLPDGTTLTVGGAVDMDGNARTIEVWQLVTCEDDGTGTGATKEFSRLFLCSDRFLGPGQS